MLINCLDAAPHGFLEYIDEGLLIHMLSIPIEAFLAAA